MSFLSRLRDTAASLLDRTIFSQPTSVTTAENTSCETLSTRSTVPRLREVEECSSRKVHRLSNCVSLAMMTAAEAASSGITFATTPCRFFDVGRQSAFMPDPCGLVPISLNHVHWFSSFMSFTSSEGNEHHIVLCTGTDRQTITMCCLLVGSFMIVHENRCTDEVADAVGPIAHLFLPFSDCSCCDPFHVEDCWQALHLSKNLGWIDTTVSKGSVEALHMEDHQHCPPSSPERWSGIYVLVPSKLIVFDCPNTLPEEAETARADQPCNRDPSYYAACLADYNVDLVVRCCEDNVYDEGAFIERGVVVENINVNDRRLELLFQRVDRFLTLARAVPKIAIHGDRSGLACAHVLISVLLIRYYGFDALAAKAWACMVRPDCAVSDSERLRFVDSLREPGLAPQMVHSTRSRCEK